ncbi:hypothetical protein K7X08_016493 [Anisodus acutangulus]|uniref:SBP-type domain-containing protein n=1 Tax=Anisodus acutangulus TaxID=402998 RepID=A0A9Q1LDU9_9SOLA|nr:hypothetical protein K7X08_016493 [Anisodus acutangulus]
MVGVVGDKTVIQLLHGTSGNSGGGQVTGMGFVMNNKRGRQYLPSGGDGGLVGPSNSSSSASPVAAATGTAALVPRCQVEGCHEALVNAKAYHRRHKVCEMHAKAPKVVVLGLEQRFCQQCSRFHSVSEFDESKRSCRRRLAGHNERRRKSSQDHYANTRNLSRGNYRHLGVNDGRALSLLSSKNDSWISEGNLPARCSSGTISELIAENRASTLAQQIILDKDWQRNQHQPMQNLSIQQKILNSTHHNRDHMVLETHGWGPMNDAAGNLTLNLMHFRNSEFGLLSGQQPKEGRQEEECQQRWNSLAGTHIS